MRFQKLVICVVFLVFSENLKSQYFLEIKGDKIQDALLRSLSPDENYGDHPDFNAHAWTNGGDEVIHRSLMRFDLSDLPAGAVIESAKLSLYAYDSPSNGKHSKLSGSNAVSFLTLTEDWDENTVTWANQPATGEELLSLPESDSNDLQDYLAIDISSLIQDMHASPTAYYGFMMRLHTESYYRRLLFASSDNMDEELQPKLHIVYRGFDGNDGVVGCTDPLSYTFNPRATISNNSCEYTEIEIDEVDDKVVIEDTLGTDVVTNCALNFDLNLDGISISNYSIQGDSILLTWELVQNQLSYFVDASYFLPNYGGTVLFTLSLSCINQGGTTKALAEYRYKTIGKVLTLNTLFANALDVPKVKTYPNPTTGNIWVEMGEKAMVQLMDLNGKILNTFQLEADYIKMLDLTSLANGVYLLNFVSESGYRRSVRVVKN